MRVQTEEWRRFIPGVRMYKGKLTYFYNGEILVDDENNEYLIYSKEERQKCQVIIVLPGVEGIPRSTFQWYENVETIIMSDSVKRIENGAFYGCKSLVHVKLSKNLEFIGEYAFSHCSSLTSIFIPESCRKIQDRAFHQCYKLIILSVPRHTTLGNSVIYGTALIRASPFKTDKDGIYGTIYGYYNDVLNNEVNECIKNLNQAEEFNLHRKCASMKPPSEDNIYEIIKQQGLPSIRVKDQIGVTALEYLEKNPYAAKNQMDQHKLIKRLVLDLMTGETITTTQSACAATRAVIDPPQKDMMNPQIEAAAYGCCTISHLIEECINGIFNFEKET